MAEPDTHIGKKRKSMNLFSHGYLGKWYCSWACSHDNGVLQLDTFVFHMGGNSIRAYKLSAIVSMQHIKKGFISKLFTSLQ